MVGGDNSKWCLVLMGERRFILTDASRLKLHVEVASCLQVGQSEVRMNKKGVGKEGVL